MRTFLTIYLLLLAYIIAALLFWGLSLQKHSTLIYNQERIILNTQIDSVTQSKSYKKKLQALEDRKSKRTEQYLGEGLTFLVVILIGAVVVYSSIKRNIRLSKQQNNFMLAVTHELKSPIAGIKLNLQTLEKHKLDESRQKKIIDQCIIEVDRLNDLCTNMLTATSIEGKQNISAVEQIILSELIEESAREYNLRYSGRIELNLISDAIVRGDRAQLQIAINNLLENAVKYAPSGTAVRIELNNKKDNAIISVIDKGVGIPDNEKGKIFNKFYRIGNEETRRTKGTGLGLYLSSKIIRQHNGKIAVRDNVPNGAVFEIYLPII